MAHKDYSGTSLTKKLGIKEGSTVTVLGAPRNFERALVPLPAGVHVGTRAGGTKDVILVFATKLSDLKKRFPSAHKSLRENGRLWLAYPKKSSGVDTDLTFENVQALGLASGLVDNKSIAVDDTYSGVQFVYRLKDRKKK